jgi:hypothetical protein
VSSFGRNTQLATDLSQAANDKQQLVPMLKALGALPEALGAPTTLLADTGYFSQANVSACGSADIEPLLALGRESHHRPWHERFTEPAPLAEPGDALAKMKQSPEDPGRTRPVRAAQTNRRAGVRHHQVGDGISRVLAARTRRGARRMVVGGHGMEHPQNGRAAGLSAPHWPCIGQRADCLDPQRVRFQT